MDVGETEAASCLSGIILLSGDSFCRLNPWQLKKRGKKSSQSFIHCRLTAKRVGDVNFGAGSFCVTPCSHLRFLWSSKNTELMSDLITLNTSWSQGWHTRHTHTHDHIHSHQGEHIQGVPLPSAQCMLGQSAALLSAYGKWMKERKLFFLTVLFISDLYTEINSRSSW